VIEPRKVTQPADVPTGRREGQHGAGPGRGLRNPEAFFRSGSSDRCRETLSESDRQTCEALVHELAPDEDARWLWR